LSRVRDILTDGTCIAKTRTGPGSQYVEKTLAVAAIKELFMIRRIFAPLLVLVGAALSCLLPLSLSADDSQVDAHKLSEGLIYSVDRTPERTFETSRAVQVITSEEIQRVNPSGLADLLEEQTGIAIAETHSGGIPSIRGLSGKQVMLLVDGVKINNATWGGTTREYLNIIDLNQVDRIEIVRGVVSVLGTESLGGVINIITKKGSPDGQTFGGSIGARYASSDSSISTPIEVFGNNGSLRYEGGITAGTFGDLNGGGNVGRQDFSSYHDRSGHLNGQYLLSPEKTIGFGYQNVSQGNVEVPGVQGLFANAQTPREMQLGNLSYQDLTSRGWEDTVHITASWNRQQQTLRINLPVAGAPPVLFMDADVMEGLNLELGTFIGKHHLVYGLDTSTDSVHSSELTANAATGVLELVRGNNMNGAQYRTIGLYLQDRVDLATWLTMIAGARYGQFRTRGSEVVDIGPISINNQQSDVTGALNLIGHVTPTLNVIGNAFRGFRAPNVDDMSHYAYIAVPGGIAFEVPNANVSPERVVSFELGLKYDDGRLSGSAFAYRNKLTNLLTLSPGTYNGLPFLAANGFDVPILQNQNVGSSIIKGYELDGRYALGNGFSLWANYTSATGTDARLNQPLSAMPPAFGTAGLRYLAGGSRRPWAEAVWRYYATQNRLGAADASNPDVSNGRIAGFDVFDIRTGLAITDRFSVTGALQNVFDKKYREVGSTFYAPGRQLVLGTQFVF
jgi:hemoglobin/transferrin/lactoferrin receptor protein